MLFQQPLYLESLLKFHIPVLLSLSLSHAHSQGLETPCLLQITHLAHTPSLRVYQLILSIDWANLEERNSRTCFTSAKYIATPVTYIWVSTDNVEQSNQHWSDMWTTLEYGINIHQWYGNRDASMLACRGGHLNVTIGTNSPCFVTSQETGANSSCRTVLQLRHYWLTHYPPPTHTHTIHTYSPTISTSNTSLCNSLPHTLTIHI